MNSVNNDEFVEGVKGVERTSFGVVDYRPIEDSMQSFKIRGDSDEDRFDLLTQAIKPATGGANSKVRKPKK
jgi:hypothetical protein